MAMRYDSGSRYTLRIGDAERDEAATQLSEHFVAGRLTIDEFNERLDRALTAKTADHLSRIMTDLPKLHRPRPVPARRPGEHSLAARYAALALLAVLVLMWLSAITVMLAHGYSLQGHAPHDWIIPRR
jgi:hypothetical protein